MTNKLGLTELQENILTTIFNGGAMSGKKLLDKLGLVHEPNVWNVLAEFDLYKTGIVPEAPPTQARTKADDLNDTLNALIDEGFLSYNERKQFSGNGMLDETYSLASQKRKLVSHMVLMNRPLPSALS